MASVKVSELDELLQGDIETTDVLLVVDDSANQSKKSTIASVLAGGGAMLTDGSTPLTGSLVFDGDGTRDVGEPSVRVRTVYADTVDSDTISAATITGSTILAGSPGISIAFEGDPDTGIGNSSSNVLRLYSGGSTKFEVRSTEVVSYVDLIPQSTIQDLGSPSSTWAEGHVTNVFSDVVYSPSFTGSAIAGTTPNYFAESTGSHTGNLFRGEKKSPGAGDVFSAQVSEGTGRGLQVTMSPGTASPGIFVASGNGLSALRMNDFTATQTDLGANALTASFNDGGDKEFVIKAQNFGGGAAILRFEADTLDIGGGQLANGKPFYLSSSLETAATYTLTDANHGQQLFLSGNIELTVPNTLSVGFFVRVINYMSGTQFSFTGSGGTEFIFASDVFQTASAKTPRGSGVEFSVAFPGEVFVAGDLEVI